jgi:hypothetical protein
VTLPPLEPNARQVAATTLGIARNMQADAPMVGLGAVAGGDGGGDLNGTAAFIMFHQAGTAGDQLSMPRAMPGGICGIV